MAEPTLEAFGLDRVPGPRFQVIEVWSDSRRLAQRKDYGDFGTAAAAAERLARKNGVPFLYGPEIHESPHILLDGEPGRWRVHEVLPGGVRVSASRDLRRYGGMDAAGKAAWSAHRRTKLPLRIVTPAAAPHPES